MIIKIFNFSKISNNLEIKFEPNHCQNDTVADYERYDHNGSENSGLIKLLICLQKDFEWWHFTTGSDYDPSKN